MITNPPTDEPEIFTIRDLEEEFPSFGAATLAAYAKVLEERRSVVIYRNGEPYATKRY